MKRTLFVLSLCLVALASCTKPEPKGVEYTVTINKDDGTKVELKGGEEFITTKYEMKEDLAQLGFTGFVTAKSPFKLGVTIKRLSIKEGTTDELCIGVCRAGNGAPAETVTYSILDEKTEAWSHCNAKEEGDNIYEYTLFDEANPLKQLTFKIIYRYTKS